MLVSSQEGHRIWSATYDDEPNPLLALNMRVLAERLGPMKGLRVVDVACGTGKWMAKAHGVDIFGVDLSMAMLTRAPKNLKGRVVAGDASQLPFADRSADLALCSLAIGYFPSMQNAIAEMARIVRRGGRVLVSDIHPEALAAGWKRAFRAGRSSYEMQHYAHDLRSFHAADLSLDWQCDSHFGVPEQWIFERAGKPMESAIPALHLACWTRL